MDLDNPRDEKGIFIPNLYLAILARFGMWIIAN